MSWKQRLAERQAEIAQKYYEEAGSWLIDLYSHASDELAQDFMNVYNEMLSTLDKKQKPAPADLYKLNSYWELQKKTRLFLESLGEDVYSYFNSQLRIIFIETYEKIAPDDSENKVCLVNEEKIQELIDKSWGRKPQSFQERIWISMTVLWDKLFGDLMYCTLKGMSTEDLKSSLLEHISNNRNALVTLFSDKTTHLRAHASLNRYRDDYKASPDGISCFGSYINTYGDEEEKAAYEVLAAAYDEYGLAGASEADDDEEEEEMPTYEIIASHGCEPCSDLDGLIWNEEIYGDVPVPVHPNCCCTVVPYESKLGFFSQIADSAADYTLAATGSIGLGLLVGVGLLTLGVVTGDDYSTSGNSGCHYPEEWLAKWGGKYPV